MNLLELTRKAAKSFIKHAYPDSVPEGVDRKLQELAALKNADGLLNWSVIEKEDSRYCLRLGNWVYPHMKLTFMLDDGEPVFYVDAHDSHFAVPENTPGYDRLLALRQTNQGLKQKIENDWYLDDIPIFGRVRPKIVKKKSCENLTVLAIDDEVQILDMLGIIVQSLGASFLRAQTISEARDIYQKSKKIDVIFCDVMMPEESGYDFVAWLKEKKNTTPVYFITGLTFDHVVKDGVVDVLQKPFSAKTILRIIKNIGG